MNWRLEKYDEVPSTQDLAIAAANANALHRTAYLAARQTAGRGRGRPRRARPQLAE